MKVIKCESCGNGYLSFKTASNLGAEKICPKCIKTMNYYENRRDRQKKAIYALVVISIVFVFAWYLPVAI